MSLALKTVVVPVTFEPDKPTELNVDRAIQVRDDHWVIINEATVAALGMACKMVAEDGRVHLLHATLDLSPTAAIHGPGSMLIPTDIDQLHSASKKQAHAVLSTIAQRFCPGQDPIFHSAPGRPVDVVLDYVREVTADALVTAASGRNRITRFVIGSTVDKLVRQAPCPVMVVPH